jgi:hypothetical protein
MQNKLPAVLFSLMMMLCFAAPVFCQDNPSTVEMADGMRSNGKIYVVVAVILTILAGLVLYVARLDKKITRLEKENP